MFTLQGLDDTGEPFQVTWHEEGKLTGHPLILLDVEALAEVETVGCGGGPYWKGSEILKNGTAIYLLIHAMYFQVEVIAGEVPTPPDMEVPDGAIP